MGKRTSYLWNSSRNTLISWSMCFSRSDAGGNFARNAEKMSHSAEIVDISSIAVCITHGRQNVHFNVLFMW